jgi:outer membrane protein TolC
MPAIRPTALAALAVTWAAVSCGCAVGPRWHAPQAPADAGYAPTPLPLISSSAPVHGGEAQHLISGRDIPFEWWELFQSPALNSLIDKAFKANPNIAAAQAALRQAQELVYAQQGFFYPSVGTTFQAERHKVSGNTNSSSTIGVQANGVNLLPELEDPYHEPHNLPSYYTFYTAELTVGFVPDVLGLNRRQVESLAAQKDAQRLQCGRRGHTGGVIARADSGDPRDHCR